MIEDHRARATAFGSGREASAWPCQGERMRSAWPAALLVLASCHSAQTPAIAPLPTPAGTFADYLARARANDTLLDFQALRLSYTTTPMYDPYGQRDRDRQNSLFAALDRDSVAAAAMWADSLLAENPVTPEGHAAAAYVAKLMNDPTRAAHHRWMAWGLMRSIEQSGQGTKSSPFVVIAVYEEYALARFLELERSGRQSLGVCGTRACDNVGFKVPATGRDTTLYFDISIPMGYLSRAVTR